MSKSIENQQKLEEEKDTVEKITQKSIIKGRTTEEMMNKHVHDEKDVITDEDFKNLKIDLKLPTDEAKYMPNKKFYSKPDT